jgi:uncharacterized membrane protein YjgN (DUF898 family)
MGETTSWSTDAASSSNQELRFRVPDVITADRPVMAEVVAAVLALVSAGIFLAHAYDAYHAKPTARDIM